MQKSKQNEQKSKRIRCVFSGRLIYVLPVLLLCAILFVGGAQAAIPDEIYTDASIVSENVSGVNGEVSYITENVYTAKLFGVIPAKNVKQISVTQKELTPCGDVFGVKFFTKGVVVTDISEVESEEGIISPGKNAGLKKGDTIISVDGKEINTVESMTDAVLSSGGKELELVFVRDGNNYKAILSPIKALSDGKYKAGIFVRDSTAGIGTVTFYNPEDGSFAGLGHGIYDADTELLLPLLKGAVVDISLNDIVKGRAGHPGELKGEFSSAKTGTLSKNTACGVFGFLTKPPQTICEKMPCAVKDEIRTGPAYVLSNVDGKGVKQYDIEIVKIYSGHEPTKNFVIEVCDDKLLSLTGGIVRGMSGSPIIQNGKLIGAVTHVLVGEPTKGYGIFIENMLAEAAE